MNSSNKTNLIKKMVTGVAISATIALYAGCIISHHQSKTCYAELEDLNAQKEHIIASYRSNEDFKTSIVSATTKITQDYQNGNIPAEEYLKRLQHLTTNSYIENLIEQNSKEKHKQLKNLDNDIDNKNYQLSLLLAKRDTAGLLTGVGFTVSVLSSINNMKKDEESEQEYSKK